MDVSVLMTSNTSPLGSATDQVPPARQTAGHWLQETERISAQDSHFCRLPGGTSKGRVTRTSKRKPVFWEECVTPPTARRAGEEPRPQPHPLHSPAPHPSSTPQSWRGQRVWLPRAQRVERGKDRSGSSWGRNRGHSTEEPPRVDSGPHLPD